MDDQVFVWGFNQFGQLGLSDCIFRFLPTPQLYLYLYKIVEMATNTWHTLVVTSTGEGFGFGSPNLLGIDTTIPTIIPLLYSDSSDISLRSCSIVRTTTGRVRGFGQNPGSLVQVTGGPNLLHWISTRLM
jgi:alpha-tubulin suppressor-like RCC1 family protein